MQSYVFFLKFSWRRVKAETVADWKGIVDFPNMGMVYMMVESELNLIYREI